MVVDYVVCRRKKLPEIDKYNREIIMIPPYQVEEGDIIYVDGIQSEFIVEFIMTTEHSTQEAKFAEAASGGNTRRLVQKLVTVADIEPEYKVKD